LPAMISPEPANGDTILSARNLTRSVMTESGRRTIVDAFSFEFATGRIYTVVGPSGAGKTSLLRLFNRLDEKSGGELSFRGRAVGEYRVPDLRRKIGLVFQIPYLFPGTVLSNLTYGCRPKGDDNSELAARFLAMVGLERDMIERDPEKLSVGQKQRVALARALVLEPEILLLDEPTSALDPGAARTIEELIVKLNRDLGLTIIMVTHDFSQALRFDGISLMLAGGRMLEWGPSRRLFSDPGDATTRRFINGELR